MPNKKRPVTYFQCPHCGEQVKSTATACRYCGSDRQTGWSENYDDESELDDDENDFDYDDYIAREFPDQTPASSVPKFSWTRIIIILLIISMCLGMIPFFAF